MTPGLRRRPEGIGVTTRTRVGAERTTERRSLVQPLTLHYSEILDRWAGDTRPINPSHVEALAESILALETLIQPITIDRKGRLIAGGHRRAAIVRIFQSRQLAVVEARDRIFPLGLVPVHRLDLDSAENESGALAAEAAENEKRKDYTPAEVRAIARKLEALGYERTPGKPRQGSKSLIKALSSITRKSRSSLYRDLAVQEAPPRTEAPDRDRHLECAVRAMLRAAQSEGITEARRRSLLDVAQLAAGCLSTEAAQAHWIARLNRISAHVSAS